jgi:hypothetical protein
LLSCQMLAIDSRRQWIEPLKPGTQMPGAGCIPLVLAFLLANETQH